MIALLLTALAAASAHCPAVQLTVAKDTPARFAPKSRPFAHVSANFSKAYAAACAEGLVKNKKLAPTGRLVVHNAPDANIASIYDSNGRTLLEYWFVTRDGKTHVPAVEELHEAIYCSVHGASEKEQEESGRCLPD
jgi:hypothetical protein